MEDNPSNTISIGEQDEIVEIIEKIKNVPARTVTLSIPKGAIILQDVTNLKILQKKVETLGKEISISRSGDLGLSAAAETLAAASSAKKIAPEISGQRFSHLSSRIKRVSDMVETNGTVDLRQMRPGKPASAPKSAAAPEPIRTLPIETSAKGKEDDFLSKIGAEKKALVRSLPDDAPASAPEKPARDPKDLFAANPRLKGEKRDRYDFSDLSRKKKKRSSVLPTISAKFFAFFILICVLTASAALFFILPKATIAVALKKETVKSDFTFQADPNAQEIDAEEGKLPAAKSEITSEKTQTFETKSKKKVTEKATGAITIYNECSTGEQVLVAGTRFLSKDTGKIFKIESGVTIPGFDKPEDETVPGSKTVKVVAEGVGESYNIAPTSFTIPKLQELSSWKYSCLYARSAAAMTGGLDKEVGYVAQADYDQAVATLTAAVKEANQKKLGEQKSDELIYINDLSDEGKVSAKSPAKVGDVADKFDLTVSIVKSVSSVTKADLETLLADKIKSSSQFENAEAVADSLLYEVGDIASADKKTTLSVSAQQDFAFHLDEEALKSDLGSKNRQQLNDYFAKIDGIKSVSIKLWPFWVDKVPNSQDKIFLTVED